MRSHTDYQLAHGSIVGRDHRLIPKNCQDSAFVLQHDNCTIAIVTDGCSSGAHSEVGAQLGARLLATTLQLELATSGNVRDVRWPRVRQDLLAQLHVLAKSMGSGFSQTVMDFFLFSIVGVIMAKDEALFFSIGDGIVIINGQVTVLEPLAGNRPAYLAYGLVDSDIEDEDPQALQFRVIDYRPLNELQHFLIGCDGVEDLIEAQDHSLPGLDQAVGDVSQFWIEDKYFRNSALVTRRLKLIARDWPAKEPQPGLLPDDTTLIVGHYKP